LERKERAAYYVFAGAGTLALVVIALIGVYVFRQAWPSFHANGIHWFGSQADPNFDREMAWAFTGKPPDNTTYRTLHAWPAIYGTLLTTGGAVVIGFFFSLLSSIFIAELAPRALAAIVEPVVRILAAVPSVVWGLFGLLALAPIVDRLFVSDSLANRYSEVVALQGSGLLLGTLVLTLMITPFMIAIFTDALRAVPAAWHDGALALGMSRWRTALKICLPVIRPALVAGTVLATGRAIGEAIMLSMTTGALGFVPNPLDGLTFFLEPVRPLASSIVDYSEGIEGDVLRSNLFAFGAVIFVTALALMIAARIATRPARQRASTPIGAVGG
jgi:phosphate ABC transporter permease protein PstC